MLTICPRDIAHDSATPHGRRHNAAIWGRFHGLDSFLGALSTLCVPHLFACRFRAAELH